jgi:hypothetical protein
VLSGRDSAELGPVEAALIRGLVQASTRSASAPVPDPFPTVDWDRMVEAAERHRLAPLVLQGIQRSHVIERTPRATLDRLRNVANLELAKAVVRLHHVDELGAAAFDAGLDLCLLKGAAFATRLYPDPGTRPMTDIDLLVRRSQFSRWRETLQALGYGFVGESDHATCFRRHQSGVFVELHRELTSSASFLGLDGETFLDRSVLLHEGERFRLRTLDWEDHLLHLSLHGSFQHGFRQPAVNAWDAKRIVERADFDLDRFLARAESPRLASWVFGGLAMCAAVFPSRELGSVLDTLSENAPKRIIRKARSFRVERLLAPHSEAVFGAPLARLTWAGSPFVTLSLLLEISRPRPTEAWGVRGGRLRRIVQLVRNHGIQAIRTIWKKRPSLLSSLRPASLGEVRDV